MASKIEIVQSKAEIENELARNKTLNNFYCAHFSWCFVSLAAHRWVNIFSICNRYLKPKKFFLPCRRKPRKRVKWLKNVSGTFDFLWFCLCISNKNGEIRLNKTDIQFIPITRADTNEQRKSATKRETKIYIRKVTKLQTDTLCNKSHFNTVGDWIFDEQLFLQTANLKQTTEQTSSTTTSTSTAITVAVLIIVTESNVNFK